MPCAAQEEDEDRAAAAAADEEEIADSAGGGPGRGAGDELDAGDLMLAEAEVLMRGHVTAGDGDPHAGPPSDGAPPSPFKCTDSVDSVRAGRSRAGTRPARSLTAVHCPGRPRDG